MLAHQTVHVINLKDCASITSQEIIWLHSLHTRVLRNRASGARDCICRHHRFCHSNQVVTNIELMLDSRHSWPRSSSTRCVQLPVASHKRSTGTGAQGAPLDYRWNCPFQIVRQDESRTVITSTLVVADGWELRRKVLF